MGIFGIEWISILSLKKKERDDINLNTQFKVAA